MTPDQVFRGVDAMQSLAAQVDGMIAEVVATGELDASAVADMRSNIWKRLIEKARAENLVAMRAEGYKCDGFHCEVVRSTDSEWQETRMPNGEWMAFCSFDCMSGVVQLIALQRMAGAL